MAQVKVQGHAFRLGDARVGDKTLQASQKYEWADKTRPRSAKKQKRKKIASCTAALLCMGAPFLIGRAFFLLIFFHWVAWVPG